MDTMFFDDMVLRHTKGVKYAMKKKTMEKFEKLNEHNEVYDVPVAAEPVVVVKYEECPICCTSVPESTIHYADTGAACGHGACVTCWKTWVDSQLPACRRNFQIRVRCMACPRTLDQSLVFEVSEAACKLAENLHRRFQLQDNPLFPECMQVECRKAGCVGIGYLGYETIMCMVCEEQWPAAEEGVDVHHAGNLDVEVMSFAAALPMLTAMKEGDEPVRTNEGEYRLCPNRKCKMVTEKRGGCDHMTCVMCKHEYYWSTGKAYR